MPPNGEASSSRTATTTGDARKKRGTPSDFQGARMEFLKANLDAYAEHSKKKTLITEFWPQLFHSYWRLFPWRLPLTEEPAPGCAADPNAAEAAFKAVDLNLTEAEQAEKSKVQTDIKAKIKRWFNRQRPGTMGIYANPYFAHLKLLRAQDGSAPKRMPDYQYYMQHQDFKQGVAMRFIEESGGVPKRQHMALRCDIARDMLAAEPQEVRARISEESTAAHDAAMDAYTESADGVPSADPEIQKECRKNFLNIVSPLLQGLQAYTGYTLNLTAARIDEGRLECASANAGTVGGKSWSKWDEGSYSQMLTGFGRFVHASYLESLGLPPDGTTSAPSASTGPSASASSSSSASAAAIGANMMQLSTEDDDSSASNPTAPPPPPPPIAPNFDVQMGPPPPPPLDEDDDDDIMSGAILPAFSRPSFLPVATAPMASSTSTSAPPASSTSAPPAPSTSAPPAPSTSAAPAPAAGLPSVDAAMARMAELDRQVVRSDAFGVRRMNVALHAEVVAMPDVTRGEYNAAAEAHGANGGAGALVDGVICGNEKERTHEEEDSRKAKRTRKGEEEEWSGSESGSDTGTETETETQPAKAVTTRARGGGKSKGDTGAVAQWAEKLKSMLLEGAVEGLVDAWWALEASTKFVSKTKSHPTTSRPREVGLWVKSARKGTPQVIPESFGEGWWVWWRGINPEWRVSNEWLFECGGVLRWWRLAAGTEPRDWIRAVEDVKWVLQKMVGDVPDVAQTLETPSPTPAARMAGTAAPVLAGELRSAASAGNVVGMETAAASGRAARGEQREAEKVAREREAEEAAREREAEEAAREREAEEAARQREAEEAARQQREAEKVAREREAEEAAREREAEKVAEDAARLQAGTGEGEGGGREEEEGGGSAKRSSSYCRRAEREAGVPRECAERQRMPPLNGRSSAKLRWVILVGGQGGIM
ncbi:hypothetical protein C8F04DRAFT_1276504 [Mycena alexandri]|uniref:Uncharacterized protein n=1 Tax=Mycena alexandri TaxID=1745969 RepID=A0AAD6S121_9AGAR|nr:hypothetical protein C8F04DRAFT_1276504 [Mycena alexandri]